MQREKLYNLYKTATFTVALFLLKIDKVLSNQFRLCKKMFFLACNERIFYVMYSLICFILKNKIHHKMQREKPYNLQRIVYILKALFVFKNRSYSDDQCSTFQIFYTNEFSYFIFLLPKMNS